MVDYIAWGLIAGIAVGGVTLAAHYLSDWWLP
jgi:hypothetical protein